MCAEVVSTSVEAGDVEEAAQHDAEHDRVEVVNRLLPQPFVHHLQL